MDIKIIYEMNPPKVLYNDYFDNNTINKNIELFLSRTKHISEYVDGLHLTDNVLGIPRISTLMLVSMIKKLGISIPISCTCRLYDKNLISVMQFVSDSILIGIYSILILRGDEPVIGNGIIGITPSKIIKTLSARNFNNYIKLDLSFPSRIENSTNIKNKLEARPRAFVTQSINSLDNLEEIVDVSRPYGIDVIPCIMSPSKRNEISARNIGLDWSTYLKNPEKFIYEAANLTNKVLLCSPNSFRDGLELVKKLKKY